MKVLFITIGICIVILSGCAQQFSNAKEVNRRLSEQRNYDRAYSNGNAETNGYDKEASEYGPRIDLVKVIWGD